MRYLVGFMIVVFFVAGLGLVAMFLRELWWKLRRCGRMKRADGEIVSIVKKVAPRGPKQTSVHSKWMYFPVITFTPPDGAAITFQSEMGDGGAVSRYQVGQRLVVRYDPLGEVPPAMDSWAAFWMPTLFGVFAGLVFLFGSFLTTWAFGERVLHGP